jgi:hypothetical protein
VSGQPFNANISALWRVRRPTFVPRGEGSLSVGVDYPSRCVSAALGFDGEVRSEHSLSAATLLRSIIIKIVFMETVVQQL